MYVKKEALLSAQIEGTQASLEDVFKFENSDDVAEVINYIKALNYGLKELKKLPMSSRLIKKPTLPTIIDCALIHYQFETIRPFLDGNGRLGRLLITFYLCWKGLLEKLFYTPLISIKDVQNKLNISFQTASHLMNQFEKVGIVKEIAGKKRKKRYLYVAYVSILSEGTQPI